MYFFILSEQVKISLEAAIKKQTDVYKSKYNELPFLQDG